MSFNPNITQRVIIKAKTEATLFSKAMAVAHKTLPVYYCYLVGLSITLQATVPDLSDYIPERLRHYIVGGATIIVFFDKLYRSRPVPPPS